MSEQNRPTFAKIANAKYNKGHTMVNVVINSWSDKELGDYIAEQEEALNKLMRSSAPVDIKEEWYRIHHLRLTMAKMEQLRRLEWQH